LYNVENPNNLLKS